MEPLTSESNMGFARKLASPKKKTREKSLSLLVLWLTSQKQLEENELRKVWKGLFYCVWHSDKAPVQADLIQTLASVLEKLDIDLALKFFKVFLTTMRQEWSGIDRLRLDKFYLLLRKFLAHMFTALQITRWHPASIKMFMDILLENAFLAKDQYAALGINLHYADIYLQELKEFLPFGPDSFKLLLEPFLVVCAQASDKSLLQRIKDTIFRYLFDLGHIFITGKKEGHDQDFVVETLGSLFLSVRLGPEAFKLASLPGTPQANRKILYTLHTDYEKLEKLLEVSGITLCVPKIVIKAKKKKKKPKKSGPSCPVSYPTKKGAQDKLVKHLKRGTKCVLDEDTRSFAFDDVNDSSVNFTNVEEGMQNNQECMPADVRKIVEIFVPKEGLKDLSLSKKQKECMQTVLRDGIEICTLKVKDLDKVTKRKNGRSVKRRKVALVQTGACEGPFGASNGLGVDEAVASKLEEEFDMLAGGKSDVCTPDCKKLKGAASQTSGKKKRKRPIRIESAVDDKILVPSVSADVTPRATTGGNSSGKVKKVRFALKKNLVWTPSTPLPDGVVRIPPSATPRGSALKKGVPPGPIVSETANMSKKRNGTLMWSSVPKKFGRFRKHKMDYSTVLCFQDLMNLYNEEP